MSEQLIEPGISRTPNTLTTLEIKELQAGPEALFSNEASNERGVGGTALLGAMAHEETPEEVLRREFDSVIERSRSVPGNSEAAYLGEQWVRYAREALLPHLKPERRITVNYGDHMVTGRLKGYPTITATERSPMLISIVMTDEQTGKDYEAAVTLGQITDLTDQTKNPPEAADGSTSEATDSSEQLAA